MQQLLTHDVGAEQASERCAVRHSGETPCAGRFNYSTVQKPRVLERGCREGH